MKELEIKSTIGGSRILVGESIKNVSRYLPKKRLAIITDTNINKLYHSSFPEALVIEIGTGEGVKSLETVHSIIGTLIDNEFDRSCFILGIGGGIVCDMTGFVASIFMRGVDFGFVSTTLLAQVDASVGGKNGVNHEGYKNMIGVFALPLFVICDIEMLKTLPHEELVSGFAEVVKHGAIADIAMIEYIEQHTKQALASDNEVLERFVYDSVVIKSTVVNSDATEKGERRKLNFGHTFGHAVEKITHMAHGCAVSIGMVVAAELSVRRGLLVRADADRLKRLLLQLQLPVVINVDKDEALQAMKRDKKREGDTMHFVLLNSLGSASMHEINMNELKEIVYDLCSTSGAER